METKKWVLLGTGGTIAGTAAVAGDNVGYTAAQLSVQALWQGSSSAPDGGEPWLLEQVGLRDKALEAVLELHKDGGESQGYLDDGSYGDIPHCCTECGSLGEYGVPWPCATVTAIHQHLGDDQ